MNQIEKAKWEIVRTKGKWRFVLLVGVLGWGGFMSLIEYSFTFYYDDFSLGRFQRHVIINLIGGFFFGLMMWIIGEIKYKSHQ